MHFLHPLQASEDTWLGGRGWSADTTECVQQDDQRLSPSGFHFQLHLLLLHKQHVLLSAGNQGLTLKMLHFLQRKTIVRNRRLILFLEEIKSVSFPVPRIIKQTKLINSAITLNTLPDGDAQGMISFASLPEENPLL